MYRDRIVVLNISKVIHVCESLWIEHGDSEVVTGNKPTSSSFGQIRRYNIHEFAKVSAMLGCAA
jgi:hypothetical protein